MIVLKTKRLLDFCRGALHEIWRLWVGDQQPGDTSARTMLEREARCGAAQFSLEPKAFPLSCYAARLQELVHLPGTLISPDSRLGPRPVAPNLGDRLPIDVTLPRGRP